MRAVTPEELCHERLGDEFERALSTYDTRRRVETLIDQFLTDDMVAGKDTLDVGCGLGYFSKRLAERGARLIACDIGPNLVQRTRDLVGCRAEVADALELVQQFGPDRFDLVVSSECIEHTPSPQRALEQMAAVLLPAGSAAEP
jgi:2-polyprenyl-3-methyl-5-hydroxy-6-metoxy-1,4-benzoquinol methylase